MGTEVLRPQDCLIQPIRVAPAAFHRRKSYNGNGNPRPNVNSYRKPPVRSDQRKRSPEPPISKRSSSSEDLRLRSNNNNQNNLVLGQVTILRRGELIDSKIKSDQAPLKKKCDEMMVCGTERLGPGPEMVPKQIRLSPASSGCRSDMYAGSAFSLSPSPRSLPLPSFFSKKQGSEFVDDSATRDLRRLLRLD